MHVIEETTFAERKDKKKLDEYPLVVHRKPGSKSNRLLLLIDGLRGHRYGYWGQIPSFLFRDFPDCDIGLYFYRTASRRFGLSKSVDLEDEGGVLVGALSQAMSYREIVVIAHSMGGLLAKSAIYKLLTEGKHDHVGRLIGLILLACPQLGSMRVPSALRLVSRDAQALFPHNELVRRIQAAFTAHICLEAGADDDARISLPTWVGLAAADCWVDALSASIGVPWDQQTQLRGSHSDIVRPDADDAPSYEFVKSAVIAAFDRRRCTRLKIELVVEDATEDDMQDIKDIAIQYFGADIDPNDDLRPYVGTHSFKVIRLIRRDGTGVHSKVKGYINIFHLRPEAAAQVLNGTLTGATITPAASRPQTQ